MLVALIDVLGTALDYAVVLVRDWWLVAAVVAFALAGWPLPRVLGRAGDALEAFAARPWRAAIAVGLLCLAWSAGLLAWRGGPHVPAMHDDAATHLGAQMFAEGRASYPTHPLWPHFEQFHVLHVPSHASKYPIGNELLMGLALRLTGVALVGSMLAAALASMGTFWALQGALPGGWALAGAIAAAIHPVMQNYSLSYRGGGLAVLGGALLFGAVLRMACAPSARLGAIAGAGLALLAMSRPYEGVVLAAGCALALLLHRRRGLMVPALVCVGVACVGLVPIALHNRAVTGSFTTLPWVEYARQYDPAPQFVWQEPREVPRYRNEELRFVYERQYRTKFDRVTAPGGLTDELEKKAYFIQWMLAGDPETRLVPFLWPLFLVPFLMLPRVLRDERCARMAAVAVLLFAFAPLSMFVNLLVQYLAPVAAAVALLMMVLVRALIAVPRMRWMAVAVAVALIVNAVLAGQWRPAGGEEHVRLERLAGGGKHLFLVAPDVYDVLWNGPEIDAQRVVWARDLGDNAALLAYYRDRLVWRVEQGGRDLRLVRLQ